MGKRFLVSMILFVAVVTGIVIGSSIIFSNRYEALEEQQSEASMTQDELAAKAEQALEDRPVLGGESSREENSALPEPETSPVELPSSDASALQARLLVQDMSLEEKICQMLFVSPEALTGYSRVTQSGDATKASLQERPVGGVIYSANNLVTADQTSTMIENLQNYSREITGRGLFIGVDEEGGTVARVAETLGTTAFEDMAVYGAQGDTEAAYDIGATQAKELTALGFNVNFSPVADVLTNEDNDVVKVRSFGEDPELVSGMVTEVVKGLTDGGMLCSPKHFPGHGSTGGDTHDGFAASYRTIEELRECDLKPFQAAIDAGAPMVMVGHMTMTEIDDENPACMSGTIVTGLLRDEMDYDGIIITDALDMGAVTDEYTNGEAAVAAISAGCDMLLGISNITSAVTAVTDAVEKGTIAESRIDESVARILAAKLRYGIMS